MRFLYTITQLLFYVFGYQTQIVKPRKSKSVHTIPTTFKIVRNKWLTIILGIAVVLVTLFGVAIIGLKTEPYTKLDVFEFFIFDVILILAFLNQLLLKGNITLTENYVKFDYRYIFGNLNKTEAISDYNCIWIQKYRAKDASTEGLSYKKIYLSHSWNRFRTLYLYKGDNYEKQAEIYSNLFNLKVKKSFWNVRSSA